jgi:asparagine synthase (glutamine-hydrolysing)
MLYLLRHRGPDEFGIYRDASIGLAHARLSIIDLSTGQQPMCNEDGSLWIVFNGEIFNYIELRKDMLSRGHRFRTMSDTEVILHLYEEKGCGALDDLNGQFAFAIWDNNRKELFLARDRMGIRPLFYTRAGNDWVFGSEVKAIFAHPGVTRRIDPFALDDIFTFWLPLSPRTCFEGISEVPPAHSLTINEHGASLARYWDLPEETDPRGRHGESYYAEALRELMVDSTRLQLRADVPVGAYLSGGLDSSVIASLIRNFTPNPLRTFSIRFEDPEFDESDKQKIMSDYLGTDHSDFTCGYGDIAEAFPKVIWHTEAPILRTAPVPLFLLSRLVKDNSYKVVLTGEGSDEILAGYDLFKEAKVRRFMEASPDSRMRPLLLNKLYPYLQNSPTRSVAYAKAFFGAPIGPFPMEFHSHAPRWNMTSMIKGFYSRDLREEVASSSAHERVARLFGRGERSKRLDPLTWSQEIEIKTLLPSYLLSSQGDRMLMGNSVEGRFPFLDHRVVEFAMRIPPGIRMKGLTEKYILRKSMEGLLPREINRMVKQPYRAPDAKSFFGIAGGELAREMLSPDGISRKGYFDPIHTERLVKKCRGNPATGFKDNMAFIGILSTQILDQLFIRDFHPGEEIPADLVRLARSGKAV